jgi:hypothetical protein
VIVPIEAFVDVLSDADVMTLRIGVAANDVHESLAKPLLGLAQASIAPSQSPRNAAASQDRQHNLQSRERARCKNLHHRV